MVHLFLIGSISLWFWICRHGLLFFDVVLLGWFFCFDVISSVTVLLWVLWWFCCRFGGSDEVSNRAIVRYHAKFTLFDSISCFVIVTWRCFFVAISILCGSIHPFQYLLCPLDQPVILIDLSLFDRSYRFSYASLVSRQNTLPISFLANNKIVCHSHGFFQ